MVCEFTKRFKEYPEIPKNTKEYNEKLQEYKEIQKEHGVEQNGMRMYKEIPRNTTRFQGIPGNTKGALSRTEWYGNVQRYSMEYNEIPRNTKEYDEIPRNTRRYKRNTK